MKKLTKNTILTTLLCLLFGMTAFVAEDDKTATVTITNLAGYGGILELYKNEETIASYTQEIPLEATSVTIENLTQGNYRTVIRGGAAVYEELEFVILTTYNSETGCYEREDVELTAKYEEPGLTKDADLRRGVGVLEGSDAPGKGEGYHCVICGHAGFAKASLFSNLRKLQIGDEF